MESKKINQLATNVAPVASDLTIVGDPITGVSKKITLSQIASLFAGSLDFYTNLAGFPVTGLLNTIYCAKDTQKLYLWSGSAYVETFPSQAVLNTYQLLSAKGVANGYASLDASGKVPIGELPSSIMEYKGLWSAATNTPTLANGTGDTGDVYIASTAGSVNFGAGAITFAIGDYVIYSGSIWQRSSGAVGTVTSVAITESGDSLNITGSPITTSGTINIGFNGTNLQYVNGAGNLTTFPILTGFVPYTGATANVDLGVFDLTADLITGATGSFASNGGSDTFAINHSSGAGIALNITKGGNGEGLYINKTSGSGNAATIIGTLEATTLVKNGGTSSQFLKADGTVDSNTYALDSLVVHLAGNETITGVKNFNLGLTLQDGYYPTPATGYVGLGSNGSGITILTKSGVTVYNNNLQFSNASNSYYFPNATGTIALTSDIPSLAGYVTLATTQTITGAKTFSGYTTFTSTVDITSGLTFSNSGFTLVLQPPTLSVNRTVTLPDATGTLALTTDIPSITGLVPYTGATGDVTLGNFSITGNVSTFKNSYIDGSASTNGQLMIKQAVLGSTNYAGYTSFYSTGTNISLLSDAGSSNYKSAILSLSSLTNNTARTYTLPDANGTIALVGGSGVGTVTSVAALTIGTTGTDLSSTVANSTTTPVITLNVPTASATNRGALSSADWTTFNNKQSALTNPVTGTGTTNYLPKFTGTSTIGNSIVQENGTGIGIGGAATQKFSVFGSAALMDITSTTGTNFNGLEFKNTSGSFYVGQDSSTGGFYGGAAYAGSLYVSGAYPMVFFTNATERMRITSGGNVLIGTTTDAGYKLDVNGTGRFSGNLTAPNLYAGSGTGAPSVQVFGGASSNSIGGSAYITLQDVTNTRFWGIQADASQKLNFWHYNGGWSSVANISSTGAATFSSSVTATKIITTGGNGAEIFNASTATTGSNYFNIRNTGAILFFGIESSGGNALQTGASAYASVLTTGNATDLSLGTGQVERLRIAASTGAATFSSSVTATSFFESSDSRLKTLIQDNYQTKGIASITPKLYTKNGKVELGYYAQDFVGILDSAVVKGSDDMLSLSYREVLVAKVYALEQRIKELETK